MKGFLSTALICVLLILFSCTNHERKSEKMETDNKTIKIVNNELLSELTESISIKYIDEKFSGQVYSLDKTLQKNKFDSFQADSIFNYQSKLDQVSIYRSVSNEFLLSLSVKSKSFAIGKCIKVGMTADKITKLLKIKEANYDTISIEADEETSSTNVLRFIFKNKILKQITFYSIPD